MIRSLTGALLVSVGLGFAAGPDHAGRVSADGIAHASSSWSRPEDLIARRLTQHIGRFARPGPAEDPQSGYRAATAILRRAAALAPDDVEVHRRLAAAAALAGAEPHVIAQADRDLLRLEPDHAAAQWRIIQRAIEERQSVAERLDLCRRFLESDAGRRLAREVRSRIAFRAASLALEQDRTSVATSWLEEALRQNPTNLDAAALLALETDRHTARRAALVRALMALVKADPLNEAALADLTAAVQEAGCFTGAANLIEAMSVLAARAGASITDDLFADYAMLRAAESGPRTGLDLIAQRQQAFDRAERQRLQREWYEAQQEAHRLALAENRAAPPLEEMPTFEDARVDLSLHVQITRALLALAADDAAQAAAALAELERRWEQTIADLDAVDRAELPAAALDALAADRRRALADRAWIRLWLNLNLDAAAADLAWLEADAALPAAELERLRGWLTLRRAQPQAALGGLQALAGADPLAALGAALALEQLDRGAEAVRLLGEIHLAQPGSLLGVWSRWRCEKLTGRPVAPPPDARAVERELGRLPQTLSDLILRPQRHFSLTIAPRAARVEPLDAMLLDVTIRNDSPWPAAIGPGRIIPSRLAVFPIFHLAGRRIQTGTPPLTVELSRRMMLLPSESMTTTIALDHTLLGLLIPGLALRPLSVEFQAMLDYVVQPDGSIQPRPWSLVRQSSAMQVQPWRESLEPSGRPPDARFAAGDVHESMRAISEIGAILHGRLTRTLDPQRDAALIAEAEAQLGALVERWPSLDPSVAAWAVLTLPFQKEGIAQRIDSLDRFEATARRSTDPLVQTAWIAARTSRADDVVIESALRSDDPDLRALAAHARAYLQQPPPADSPALPTETPAPEPQK